MNSRTFIVTSFFFEYFDTAMPRPGVMAGRWTILPPISAPGTTPKPALPTITDSAGLPPRLPVVGHGDSSGTSALHRIVFGSSPTKRRTAGGEKGVGFTHSSS